MIWVSVKLRPTPRQAAALTEWLDRLASVWNFAVRKIELNARDHIYFSSYEFQNLLAGHSKKLGIPSHTIQGVLATAFDSWQRCFNRIARKPRLKGYRRPLTWIPFPDAISSPQGASIALPGIGKIRFHKQSLPYGKIKCGRIIKRPSGWYLNLCLEAQPSEIPPTGYAEIGIDPGFRHLLTISSGEKIDHPKEFQSASRRFAQAQRGGNKKLVARISERVSNRRKDRNHKLSRKLVSENEFIAFSADPLKAIARRFGKSVGDSAHYQLRQMLSYKSKCRTDGLGVYVEVDSRNSTKTCSACGALSGPTGLVGLKVRQWACVACGAEHDRDVNAAVNTLIAGAGMAHERARAA